MGLISAVMVDLGLVSFVAYDPRIFRNCDDCYTLLNKRYDSLSKRNKRNLSFMPPFCSFRLQLQCPVETAPLAWKLQDVIEGFSLSFLNSNILLNACIYRISALFILRGILGGYFAADLSSSQVLLLPGNMRYVS